MRNLIDKLAVLKKAFHDVSLAWSDCDHLETVSYPFTDSFDELVFKVDEWVEDFTEHIEAEIKEKEEEFPVTYALIKHTVGWKEFAETTDRDVYRITEHGHFQDHEIFRITLEQARKLKFI